MRWMSCSLNSSGDWTKLILVLFFLSSLLGCSTYLITSGVLDAPDQEKMFKAKTRDELEAYVGEPVKSRMSQKGNLVDLYEYVDGAAGVIGQSGRPMSGERTGRAGMTALFAGITEIFMVPVAVSERADATRKIHVIYSPDDNILAICPNKYTDEQDDLCQSEILSVQFPLK